MATLFFDFDKALNAFLYVANRVKIADFHKVFKILYFADRGHLCRYGRTITTDTYFSMEHGPVPSKLYDMVKAVSGIGLYKNDGLKIFFAVTGDIIKPLRDADTDFLSKSDIFFLDSCISQYGNKSFEELTKLSHDVAWKNARGENGRTRALLVGDIMKEGGADRNFTDYVVERCQMEREMNRC